VPFANNIPDKELFCCNAGCVNACAVSLPNCPYGNSVTCNAGVPSPSLPCQCNRIGQSMFCITVGQSRNLLPGGLCGGILGNGIPTNAMLGNCPPYQVIGNTLNAQSTTPAFS